jgi:hypothetical protein
MYPCTVTHMFLSVPRPQDINTSTIWKEEDAMYNIKIVQMVDNFMEQDIAILLFAIWESVWLAMLRILSF